MLHTVLAVQLSGFYTSLLVSHFSHKNDQPSSLPAQNLLLNLPIEIWNRYTKNCVQMFAGITTQTFFSRMLSAGVLHQNEFQDHHHHLLDVDVFIGAARPRLLLERWVNSIHCCCFRAAARFFVCCVPVLYGETWAER